MNSPVPTSNLKISVLVSDLSKKGAGRWGGGGVRPFLLSQVLKRLNYDVEILGFTGDDEPPVKTHFEDIPIHTVSSQTYPKFWQSANALMAKITGDIIYAYKPKPSSFGLALLNRLKTKRPVILDIDDWELSWHGGDQFQYRPPSLKQLGRDIFKPNGQLRNPDHPLYLKWMEKWIQQADVVTLHNQFLQQRFGGVYLPNGKDIELFNPSHYQPEISREQYQLSGYRILMFPGAPRPYKGLEDVLTALDSLNQSDLRLAIVGGSPYDDYDKQLMERWGRWIIKLPTLPIQQMPFVVAAAHVVVVPQRDEPAAIAQFPLKLTDGMAMAKPVLATRVGDIPNILADTGYLVDPSSPEQIAQTLEEIFENWETAIERGKKARERCVKFYSFQTMTNILSGVIPPLVGSNEP